MIFTILSTILSVIGALIVAVILIFALVGFIDMVKTVSKHPRR